MPNWPRQITRSAMPRSGQPGPALCAVTCGPKLRLLTVICFGAKTRTHRMPTRRPSIRLRALTEQAITYAPHDSRLWLLFAANYFRFDWLNERAASSLRMSFYTGSNSMAVVPERLLLAIQSRALQDDDFQELVRHDIQIAVAHKSELMPALIAAYNKAPPAGRQFIEKTLAELDPSMLASIRPKANIAEILFQNSVLQDCETVCT